MGRAVIVLGAGASADFGVPILRGVFKDLQARRYLAENTWLRDRLIEIFWRPRGQGLETSDTGLTIEEMLTILRDMQNEGLVGNHLDDAGCARLRRDLNILIYRAVFKEKNTRAQHLNSLIAFAGQRFEQTTWASFNWDCVFESSFWYSSGAPGPYGGRYNPRVVVPLANWTNGPDRHVFLKLHGGVNWWMVKGQLTYVQFGGAGNLNDVWSQYAGQDPQAGTPVLLEPSFYKYQGAMYTTLEPQWKTFLDSLRAASHVLFVGYSLPPLDTQARSKILTAFQTNPECRWAVVDPTQTVCDQYRVLLGNQRCTIFQTGLAGLNNALEESMYTAFPEIRPPAPSAPAA